MTSIEDNATLAGMVGRLQGRLDGLETRMANHETWIGTKIQSIESTMGMIDTKLDAVVNRQTQGMAIASAAKWVIGLLAGVSGWIMLAIHR